MHPFFSRLSYSFGNEDWNTEHEALQIQPDSNILCITASGDRPLNLLSKECASIHCVDANPVQNALLDLKKEALSHFSYEDYIAFLGINPMKSRLKRYEDLKARLAPTSQKVWYKHRRKIRDGVLYQGMVERLLNVTSKVITTLRPKKIKTLFEFEDLEKQAEFVEKEFDTPVWRRSIELALHPKLVCSMLRDPGLTENVDEEIHIGKHIHSRLHGSLKEFLAKESILLSLIFKGKVDKAHLPPYLSPASYEAIEKQVPKLTFETCNLLEYLENVPEESFDRFSLSDVASYLPYPTYEKMITSMIKAAKPGARFCIRQFLSNYRVPESVAPYLKRDHELEKRLEKEDRCCVYRFFVGEVVK